jgi:hypothetical protein
VKAVVRHPLDSPLKGRVSRFVAAAFWRNLLTQRFLAISTSNIEPEHGAPAEGRLISGDPKFRTWNAEEAEGGLTPAFGNQPPANGASNMTSGSSATYFPAYR